MSMQNFKDIPIPAIMQKLEKDSRGFPVPFVVFRDKHNVPYFKINDTLKTKECLIYNRCSICGEWLNADDKWLIGGIASAFDLHGAYIDLPIHKACGQYALQVCPYMAAGKYIAKIDLTKLQSQLPDVALHNSTVDTDKLPLFALVRPTEIDVKIDPNREDFVLKPVKPYLDVQFWYDGRQVTSLAHVSSKLVNTKWEKYIPVIKSTCLSFLES